MTTSEPRQWPFLDGREIERICSANSDDLFSETIETTERDERSGLARESAARMLGGRFPVLPQDVPWLQSFWSYLLGGWGIRHIDGDSLVFSQEHLFANEEPHLLAARLGLIMRRSIPFLWIDDLRRAAILSTLSLPRFTLTRDLFPFPAMLFIWASGLIEDDRGERGHIGNLVFVTSQGPAIADLAWGQYSRPGAIGIKRPEIPIFGLIGRWGEVIEDDPTGVFRLLAFAQSPFLAIVHERGNRANRRQWEKVTGKEMPEITMVVLRSLKAVGEKAGQNKEGVEWDWRWLVRGHFRNQWYPFLGSHRLIWIAPYVKGPEDKPLKTSGYIVAR